MKTLKIIVIIALILALGTGICLVAFTGGVINSINTELNATPLPSMNYLVGDIVPFEDHTVSVSKIDTYIPNEFLTPEEGTEIGYITVTFTNTSNKDILVQSGNFKLYKNNVLCKDYIYGDNWFMAETIGPGRVYAGVLYFQIPVGTGDSVLELEYTYDYKGSKAIFSIN